MCCRLLIFLPGCLSTLTKSRWPVSSAGLVALATAFMYMIHKGLDFHGEWDDDETSVPCMRVLTTAPRPSRSQEASSSSLL